MSLIRWLDVGDLHLAEKPPGRRTDAYKSQIRQKWTTICQLAHRVEADFVLQKGDWFHLRPHRVSHELVNMSWEMLDELPCSMFVVPGNHDLPDGAVESLGKTPLAVLLRHERVDLLKSEVFVDEELDVTHRGFCLRLLSFPSLYDVPIQDIVKCVDKNVESGERAVLVCHLPIMPPGISQPYDVVPADELGQALVGKVDVVSYGHVHEYHGIYEVNDIVFINTGSVSRDSLHEHNINRVPTIVIGFFDTQTGKFGFREAVLPHMLAAEVFMLGDVREEKAADAAFAEFAQTVGSSELSVVTLEGIVAMIRGLEGVAEDVKSRAIGFLQGVAW